MNLKRKVKSIIFMGVMVCSLLLPLVVFASSYTSTLYFTADHTGATRSYTGSNINISMICTTNTPTTKDINGNYIFPQEFTTKLYRSGFLGTSTYIGSVSSPKNGQTSKGWTNVGSGDYFFTFSKNHDG